MVVQPAETAGKKVDSNLPILERKIHAEIVSLTDDDKGQKVSMKQNECLGRQTRPRDPAEWNFCSCNNAWKVPKGRSSVEIAMKDI